MIEGPCREGEERRFTVIGTRPTVQQLIGGRDKTEKPKHKLAHPSKLFKEKLVYK